MPALKPETAALRSELQSPTHSNGSDMAQPTRDLMAALEKFSTQTGLVQKMIAESEFSGEDDSITDMYEQMVQQLRVIDRTSAEIIRDVRTMVVSWKQLKQAAKDTIDRINDYEAN